MNLVGIAAMKMFYWALKRLTACSRRTVQCTHNYRAQSNLTFNTIS